MSWTDERIEQLRADHTAGLSFGQISERLGVTRCAAIGKAHRLGLEGRNANQPRPRAKSANTRIRVRSAARILYIEGTIGQPRRLPPTPPPAIATSKNPVTFMGTTKSNCHYPISDGPPFMFCGDPNDGRSLYCAHHFNVTHQCARSISEKDQNNLVNRFQWSEKPSESAPPLAPEEMVA